MATIIIKGRLDPITIEDSIAIKIKERWLGLNGVTKALNTEAFEIKNWSGEYGLIRSIELSDGFSEPKINQFERQRELEKKQRDYYRSLTPEQRARNLSRFKLLWAARNRRFGVEPPHEVLVRAEQIQVAFYKQSPDSIIVPPELFNEILPVEVKN